MEKLKNIEKLVFEILKHKEMTRGDDYVLYYFVVNEYFLKNPSLGDINSYSFPAIMINHSMLGIPSYETVTRARRKVQEKYPELKTPRATKKRKEEEKRFRVYAHT